MSELESSAAPFCPRCELQSEARAAAEKMITPEYLAEIRSARSDNAGTAAEESVYKKRLAVCEKCSALKEQILCAWCGCYVALRAHPADSYCPYPGKDKWQETDVPHGQN